MGTNGIDASFARAVDEVDLRAYLEVLFKWKWVIALITAAAVLTSAVLSYLVITPTYEAKAVLMVTQPAPEKPASSQNQQGTGVESVVESVSRLPEMTISTYVSQLKNLSVLEEVVKALNLSAKGISAQSLEKMIQVAAIKDTNLIELKVQSTDPTLASQIANTLSQRFLDFISQTNKQQLSKSVEFLDTQAQTGEGKLEAAKKALRDFQMQPRGVTFLEKQLDARIQDLSKYKTRLVDLQVQREQLAAGKAELERLLAATPKTIKVNNPLSSQSASSTTSGNAQTGGSGSKLVTVGDYEEINPAYATAAQMLDDRTVRLAETDAELAAVQKMANQLEAEVEAISAELASKRLEQDRLQREVDRWEKTQDLLNDKIVETQIARSINFGDTSLLLVSPAAPPAKPIKPNPRLNMAVAAVLGLMVAVVLSFVMEMLDNTIRTADDVEKRLGLPVLGTVPFFKPAE
ncbi:MAG: lipopolysaccharide biosynthesis protein [Clostridia bacterium]|nr:lipopolysaccharide biosynthesis protein [Clostridia bacterium]